MFIQNLSRHQSLVGKTYHWNDSRSSICCLAAHEDAILILTHDNDGFPANYVVCHHPEVNEQGNLQWAYGEYFTILNYQTACPAATAFEHAVRRLLQQDEPAETLLAFHFGRIENDDQEALLLVRCQSALESNQRDQIEDAIASYLDAVPAFTYEQFIQEVLGSFKGLTFEILTPSYTFEV